MTRGEVTREVLAFGPHARSPPGGLGAFAAGPDGRALSGVVGAGGPPRNPHPVLVLHRTRRLPRPRASLAGPW